MSHHPVLFTNSFSPHGNIVTDFLACAGLLDKVVVKHVDFAKGEHKQPAYLLVNPAGQIPALSDENGSVLLFESDAILRYLAVKFKSALLPVNDPAAFGRVDAAQTHLRQKVWDQSTGLVYHQTFRKLFFGQEPDQKLIEEKKAGLDKSLAFVGATFFKSSPNHLVGDSWSTADTTLATAVEHAKKFANYQPSDPAVVKFIANWESQPFFKLSAYGQK